MRLSPYDWRRQAEPIPTPTRVNLGPLTTVFVPPPYCSRAAVAGSEAVLGQSCDPVDDKTASAADDTGCWPRATAYPSVAKSSLAGLGFYSPGLLCPTGYQSACTAVSTSKGQTAAAPQVTGKFQFPLVAGETAIGCCPTGYTCGANGGFQTCHQVATQTSFDAMTCDGLSGSNLDGFQVPMTLAGETVATMDLWAPMIQINHMATDLPETSTSTDATASSTGTATASRTGSKSGKASEATPTASATAQDEEVRVKDVETDASTSTKATRTKAGATASATDDSVRVKDFNEDPSNTSSEEESSKASKTAPASKKADEASITAAPSSPTPTIDLSSTAFAAGDPAGIVFDTRIPPSVASTLIPSATAAAAAAAADSTASSLPEPSQESFSTGAKVGVACAPLAGAALILLGVFYYKRRKQNAGSYQDGDAKSISSATTGASSYHSTYFGGNASTAQVNNAELSKDAYATPRANSPYNEDRLSHEMAMNGPGPAVIAPAGYGTTASASKMTPADFYANPWTDKDEYETRPFETAASRFRHAHSMSDESGSIESPIDGASPFRLKRKSTLKGRARLEKHVVGQEHSRLVSMEGSIVIAHGDASPRSSQESAEWTSPSQSHATPSRSSSFSRPRPRAARPLTTASSVYPDDRDTRIMSWDLSLAPDMPDKPLPSIPERAAVVAASPGAGAGAGVGAGPGLDRSKSFSRPRPKRDAHEESTVAVEGEGRAATPVPKGVVAPPVTDEGVSF